MGGVGGGGGGGWGVLAMINIYIYIYIFILYDYNHNRPGSSYLGSPPPLIVSARVGKGVHEDSEQVASTTIVIIIVNRSLLSSPSS